MHQCVDLDLSFVEGVRRGLDHVPVDNLADPGVQRHLPGRQDRDVVLVDEARLLLHQLWAILLLEILAGQPEQDVLLTEFAAQEVLEHLSTSWENIRPTTN